MLYEKWPRQAEKILDFVRQTVKDKTVKKLLLLADENTDKGV